MLKSHSWLALMIEHSRHRSPMNYFVNILGGGLIAYCHQLKKPSIAIDYNLLLPA